MHYLYILQCEDGYIYTGITYDLSRRLEQHKNGLCKLTKNRINCKIVYSESFDDKYQAAHREQEIKGWRREKKLKLFSSSNEFTLRNVNDEMRL